MFGKRNKRYIYELKETIDRLGWRGDEQTTQINNTKHNEEVLLYHSKDFNENLKVRLYPSVGSEQIFINLLFDNDSMKIADINILNENVSKGYGTILLDYALEIAKQKSVREVNGLLSSTDEKNRIRQIKFYEKYGFTISDDRINLVL